MPATTTTTLPASSVEVPPNKAFAAAGASAGSGGVSALVVGLALYYLAPDTPPNIAAMWDALVSVVFGGLAGFIITYAMPHGAVVKEN